MNPELESLIARYLDGVASPQDVAELSRRLETDGNARTAYLRQAHLHASLAAESTDTGVKAGSTPGPILPEVGGREPAFAPPTRRWWQSPAWLAAACVALAIAGGAIKYFPTSTPRAPVAWFGELRDCRWVGRDVQVHSGDGLRPGQIVELSSGTAGLKFRSGALVTLVGPVIFEVTSANSGFLTLGHLKANAATPESKGFTVQTRTAQVVDVGTEFVAAAAPDGQSRVDVTSGEVCVLLDGVKAPLRLRTGDALSVEAGRAQVVVRIESGDGTAAFRFPTIEPPSNRDAADRAAGRATMRVVRGTLHDTVGIPSGPPDVLLDGRGQSKADSPSESVFFANNATGLLLLDLGRALSVTKINTYSWHQNKDAENRFRAVQRFTLYGFAGDVLPATDGALAEAGWIQLARVNSDDFFRVAQPLDRPAQQACSITGAQGTVGRFRYLLWEVEPTQVRKPSVMNNTFYGEFDVYGEP